MNHDREELREVTLNDGRTGYFHTWSQRPLQVDDSVTIAISVAVVELMDGVVVQVAPDTIKFDTRTASERKKDRILAAIHEMC